MNLSKLYNEFFKSEKTGGVLLIIVTLISITLANSVWQESYLTFWNTDLGGHTLTQWINDGLMTIFFLLIGLELEREIYKGELSNLKNAALPIFAAMGGMIFPAFIFYIFNSGAPTQNGTGIPTATDIAFALGILSLLGNRVPNSLKIFLTALAVIDDLGAIIIIAIFYTTSISGVNLLIAFVIYILLLVLNRLKVNNPLPYLVGGIVMWYFMLHTGIHPSITGVLIAFAIPFGKSDETSPSYKIQHILHKPVAYLVLPIFAIANTTILINQGWQNNILEAGSLGIILGMFVGKPLGIFILSFLSVKLKFASLPSDLKWTNIIGVGFLGGIGFTMSIFITLLAYKDLHIINYSKIAIIIGSLLSAIIGLIWLHRTLKPMSKNENNT
jgi:NhaA family Na+:H+ antiporter